MNQPQGRENVRRIVNRLLETDADELSGKDLFGMMPQGNTEAWVFTEGELQKPYDCKRSDEFVAEVMVKEADEFPLDQEATDDVADIIVLRNGVVTNRFMPSDRRYPEPVPEDLMKRADEQIEFFDPRAQDFASYWKVVIADGDGNFLRWAKE